MLLLYRTMHGTAEVSIDVFVVALSQVCEGVEKHWFYDYAVKLQLLV